jgi:AraC-like DNA-binding protein
MRVEDTVREQAEHLQEAFSPLCGSILVRPAGGGGLDGEVSASGAGPVTLMKVRGTLSARVLRTRALTGTGGPDFVKVVMPTRGQFAIEHGSTQSVVVPGRLLVYDNLLPYELHFRGPWDFLVVGIPRPMLGTHGRGLISRTPTPIPIEADGQRYAASLLRSAAQQPHPAKGDSGEYLADALVALALAAAHRTPAASRDQEFAELIMNYCLAHLNNPELSPERVAQAHSVSVRHLNRILRSRGISLSAWIRSQRLERIRRDLANPALHGRSTARIAGDWGIRDTTHISRGLRSEFGHSAAEIRRAARQAQTGDRDTA